ncbi:hypothetical protein Clacol_009634 [Clathrus columnatus]|uniref:Uncharacterized protein n=1 Tax=Clathrus columnatus TaxID=1419009 RepID=A0AAV5ARQ0_9AGAM|nr:hypothetical protein Clacol_009634 [Clathrus columnatus]
MSTLRSQILQIASERDRTLHTLPTTADSQGVQKALTSLPLTLSDKGLGVTGAINHIIQDILPGLAPGHAGPRYFGFITGGVLPSAQLADFLTTIYDQNVGANRTDESIAAVIEWRALEYLLDLLDLPRDKFPARILTSGATASNVLGLALGRDYAVRTALGSPNHSVSEDGFGGVTVQVFCDRPHASLLKAAALVGIGRSNVIDLGKKLSHDGGNDNTFGMDLNELEERLKETTTTTLLGGVNGNKTAAVVAISFGEVNTGDFTPDIRGIRALCDKYSVWLHIDAAFGAYARLVPDIVGSMAEGLELGDSITSDAHKWLNVPYDCGIFFSRSIKEQQSIFTPAKGVPAYLSRLPSSSNTINPELQLATEIPDAMTLTIENSRRFRGLALYASLLDQGREGYTQIIRRNILFTRQIANWMESEKGKGYYEVLNLRTFSIPIPTTTSTSAETDEMDSKKTTITSVVRTTPLNMLLFRARKGTNPINAYTTASPSGSANLVKAINESKKMQVTPGDNAVRIAVSNWSTAIAGSGDDHLKEDFDIVVETLLSVVENPPKWVSSSSY